MLTDLLKGTTSLLFPAICLNCQAAVVSFKEAPLCPECETGLPVLNRCLKKGAPLFFEQVLSWLRFEGAARALIHAFKFEAQTALAPYLAGQLAQTVRTCLDSQAIAGVIPIPLHPTKKRDRSFDQAALLGSALAQQLNRPCLDQIVERIEFTHPQTELQKQARFNNVKDAFQLKPQATLSPGHYLLVDDVYTTGATANACAKVLKKFPNLTLTVVTLAQG